jgi:hypothetical protein
MQIVSLKIKNFMSISDVEIKPGKINQICGANSNGKTTVLKALEFNIKGSSDGSLVKFGNDQAEVLVELSDGTEIKRKLNSVGKQSVDVKNGKNKITSPQTYLEQLIDYSALNPLDLLDPKKRTDAILKSLDVALTESKLQNLIARDCTVLPPLDYTKHGLKVLDQAHEYFYGRRAEANRDTEEKKHRWETYKADLKEVPKPSLTKNQTEAKRLDLFDAGFKEEQAIKQIAHENEYADKLSEKIAKYTNELESIQFSIDGFGRLLSTVESDLETHLNDLKTEYETEVASLRATAEKQKSDFRTKIANEKGRLENGQKVIADLKAEAPVKKSDEIHRTKYAELLTEVEKIKVIEAEIETYEVNETSKKLIGKMEDEFSKAEVFAKNLTDLVDFLRVTAKEQLLSSVKMPIKGLQYVDGQFLVDGVPIENLSTSQSVKLAVGVARSLAKHTKIICLDGLECLDAVTWNEFREETENDGFTYFVTVVGAGFDTDDKKITMDHGQALQ